MKSSNVEVLQPPIPKEAFLAKPAQQSESHLTKQVEDLRLIVEQLCNKVKQLEQQMYMKETVCCVCGKLDCYEAPHIPSSYWMRYGRDGCYHFQRNNPQAWDSEVREHYEQRSRRAYGDAYNRYMDSRSLPYDGPFKY